MLDKVRKEIRRCQMLTEGTLVVVAVSGGPDSVALLHVLHRLSGEFGIRLHVFHMDHGLRGEASREDARYVRTLAQQMSLPVTVVEVPPGKLEAMPGSLEANARSLRYREAASLARRLGARCIALGHNQNDQAETVLMRLLRGAGSRGLAGIPPVRREGDLFYIRPLLTVSRFEIEEYCRQAELIPRVDESNHTSEFLRNRIRLQLLPMLQREYNPALVANLAQTAAVLRDEDDLLNSMAGQVLDGCRVPGDGVGFRSAPVLAEPVALARRVVRLAAREAAGAEYELGLPAVTQVLEAMQCQAGSRLLDLPGGVTAVLEYGICRFFGPAEDVPTVARGAWQVAGEGITTVPELGLQIEILPGAVPHGRWEAAFDADRLPGALSVRLRRPGDRIYPKGMDGSKKLQDLLVDAKVPRRLRDQIPLLVSGDEVIWVIGYRLDRRFLASADSVNILTVRVKECGAGHNRHTKGPGQPGACGCRGV